MNENKIFVDGLSFVKDKKTGYYLSSQKIGKTRIRLHRYIWQKYNGEIPKGFDIHHIDKNKDNNDISNLQLLTITEHQKIHAIKNEEELKILRQNIDKIRPLAIKWHKSEDGRQWHKKHAKEVYENLQEKEYVCQNCGKIFKKLPLGTNKFCSNKCKSAYRRKTGVDNVERTCEKCGKLFLINKYAKTKKCRCCSGK